MRVYSKDLLLARRAWPRRAAMLAVVAAAWAALAIGVDTRSARADARDDRAQRACGESLIRDLRAARITGRTRDRERTFAVMRALARATGCMRVSYKLRELAERMSRPTVGDERRPVARRLQDGDDPRCCAMRVHVPPTQFIGPQLDCLPRDPRIRRMDVWGEFDGARFEERLIAVRFIDAITQDEALVPIAQMVWASLSYDGNDPMLVVQVVYRDLARGHWPSAPYPHGPLALVDLLGNARRGGAPRRSSRR